MRWRTCMWADQHCLYTVSSLQFAWDSVLRRWRSTCSVQRTHIGRFARRRTRTLQFEDTKVAPSSSSCQTAKTIFGGRLVILFLHSAQSELTFNLVTCGVCAFPCILVLLTIFMVREYRYFAPHRSALLTGYFCHTTSPRAFAWPCSFYIQ